MLHPIKYYMYNLYNMYYIIIDKNKTRRKKMTKEIIIIKGRVTLDKIKKAIKKNKLKGSK